MLGIVAVISYLLGHDAKQVADLRLRATFASNPQKSPALVWKNVPPDASSLAILVKDVHAEHYYWVVYNLPTDETRLPFGVSNHILHQDMGLNSWFTSNYHPPVSGRPVEVELFALNQRFETKAPMTGAQFEKKIQGHVVAKVVQVQ